MPRRGCGLGLGLAGAYSLALLGDQMLYVFLPSHPAEAGIAASSLGLVLSANRIVRLAANSLGGVLSDRLGRRRPYLLGMVLALVSTAGYLVSHSLVPLLVCRMLWGIAFSLLVVGGVSLMLDHSVEAERGRTIGLYQALLAFGTLLALVLSGLLTDLLGYRGTLMVYVPLTALAWASRCGCCGTGRPLTLTRRGARERRPAPCPPSAGSTRACSPPLTSLSPRTSRGAGWSWRPSVSI